MDDLVVFQLNVLSSLTPNIPVEENLRAIMAPALAKLMDASAAHAAAHVFVNPELDELHVMVVGRSARTTEALGREMVRRHASWAGGVAAAVSPPDADLPAYVRIEWPRDQSLFHRDASQEYCETLRPGKGVGKLLTQPGRPWAQEFSRAPQVDDQVLVLPLGSRPYLRLGYIVLWTPERNGSFCSQSASVLDYRFGFRNAIERMLVRVFTNFYRMEPQTYLPSFCGPGPKPVTLFCAEIWNFDDVANLVWARQDLDQDGKVNCLRSLVNRFVKTSANVVDRNQGRLDQIWGNGVLGVFGEYLNTPESSAGPGCKWALNAAADLVTVFREELSAWLDGEFGFHRYRELHAEGLKIAPVVAIDHGEVIFEYVGSQKHRRYMAVGDRINFVKRLVTAAGSVLPGAPAGAPSHLASGALDLGKSEGPPILLSQSAHTLARDMLQGRPGQKVGEVDSAYFIPLSGLARKYPVYPLYPDNILRAR